MSIGKGMLWSLATVLLAASANAVCKPVDGFFLSIRIFDESRIEKQHVDQTVKVSKDGMVTFFSGGEFGGSDDAPPLEFGTRITGKLIDSVGEAKGLTLRVEFSTRFISGKSKIPVVRGETVALRADVNVGETTRISLGGNRWCELRLERQEK